MYRKNNCKICNSCLRHPIWKVKDMRYKTKDIFRIDQTDDYQAESEVAQEDIYTNFKALQGGGELQGISSADSPQFTGLTLTGNLSVSGTTTTIDSTTVSLGDKITTGKPSSINAKGPCFISPAG